MGKLQFYIMADNHYFSKKLWVDGPAIERRCHGDQVVIKESPEVNEAFFKLIEQDSEADLVVIIGDLINCGERLCHDEFIERLHRLENSGKRVLVLTATHDYNGCGEDENGFVATGYAENSTYRVDCTRRHELDELYRPFGRGQADREYDMSYSINVGGYRFILLNDDGNGHTDCGLDDKGNEWLENELIKAKTNSETVLLFTHHPVITPYPVYEAVAPTEMYGRHPILKAMLMKHGVKVVFTGHVHTHAVRRITDGTNELYDVGTTAVVSPFGKIRRVTLDNGVADISTVDMPKEIDGVEGGSDHIAAVCFGRYYKHLVELAAKDYDSFLKLGDGLIPVDKAKKYRFIIKPILKIILSINMSFAGKVGRKYSGLSKAECKAHKDEKLLDMIFTIIDHFFIGDAPFTPDTYEHKVIYGALQRADAVMRTFKISLSKYINGIDSLWVLVEPLIHNTRTGCDREIKISLKDEVTYEKD
ncbi:MAG: metallophosphoesterase [Clostridia bacterium]|nr:metallophosphoesterase [Clostridia bacterium]